MRCLFVVSLVTLLSLSSAVPQDTTDADTLTDDCQDISLGPAPQCWDSLEMPQWMRHWNNTQTICRPEEIWSSCLMRAAFNDSSVHDCDSPLAENCIEPTTDNESIRKGPATQYYAAYNIYCKPTWQHLYYSVFELTVSPQY